MESQIRKLWKFVKPKGGKLAITTWGPRIFEPAYSYWNNILRLERPDLYSAFNSWDRITVIDNKELILTSLSRSLLSPILS